MRFIFHMAWSLCLAAWPGLIWAQALAPIQVQSQYGYIDTSGAQIFAPQFDEINPEFRTFINSDEVAIVRVGKQFGVINPKGNFSFPLNSNYEKLEFLHPWWRESEVPLAYVKNKKKGLMTTEGRELTPPQYDEFRVGSQGYTFVTVLARQGSKWGMLDRQANVLLDFEFEEISDDQVGPYWFAKKEGSWGFLNEKFQWKALPPAISEIGIDTKVTPVGLLVSFCQNEKCGIYDVSGKMLLPAEFDDINAITNHLLIAQKGEDILIYNLQGKLLLTTKDLGGYITDNLIFFLDQNGLYGYVDAAKGKIFPGRFGDGQNIFSQRGSRNDVLAVITEKSGKMGVIDPDGNYVIPSKYDEISPYAGGARPGTLAADRDLFWARQGASCGYLDWNGKVVIPFQYRKCDQFHAGVAIVCVKDRCILINHQGQEISQEGPTTIDRTLSSEFFSFYTFDSKCANGGFRGYLNRKGQIVYREDCAPKPPPPPPPPPPPIGAPIAAAEFPQMPLKALLPQSKLQLSQTRNFEKGLWYQNGLEIFEFELSPEQPACQIQKDESGLSIAIWPLDADVTLSHLSLESNNQIRLTFYTAINGQRSMWICRPGTDQNLSVSDFLNSILPAGILKTTEFWRQP